MAEGDIFSHKALDVAAGAYTDVDSSLAASEEAIVQNVVHEDSVTLEYGDGTDWTPFHSEPGDGIIAGLEIRIKKGGHRIRIKNDHASVAKDIWVNGVKTK